MKGWYFGQKSNKLHDKNCAISVLDALMNSDGPILYCVDVPDGIDCTDVLREFARWCALQAAHLWNAPDMVLRYLETGDNSMINAARNAGWAIKLPKDVALSVFAAKASWDAALDSMSDNWDERNAISDSYNDSSGTAYEVPASNFSCASCAVIAAKTSAYAISETSSQRDLLTKYNKKLTGMINEFIKLHSTNNK